MALERRSTNSVVRISNDSPNGTIEGLCSIKGYLDDHGTIWIDNSYGKLDQFLKRGYMPDTHSIETRGIPTLDSNVAMPVDAYETPDGLFIKGEFHSKPRAQDARTMVRERSEKGQDTGFSIGFNADTIKSFRIYPKDYTKELPKYLKTQYLTAGLNDAKRFPYVEILTYTEIEEVSILLCQSHEDAIANNVRTMNTTENKRSEYLGEFMEANVTVSALSRVTDALMYNVFYDCCYNENIPVEESKIILSNALDEFKSYCLQIFDLLQQLDASDNAEESATRIFAESLRKAFNDPKDCSPINGQRYKQQLQQALNAVRDCSDRTTAIANLRSESKMILVSDENHKTLSEIHSEGVVSLSKLSDFLRSTNPKANEETLTKANTLRSKILQRKLQSI